MGGRLVRLPGAGKAAMYTACEEMIGPIRSTPYGGIVGGGGKASSTVQQKEGEKKEARPTVSAMRSSTPHAVDIAHTYGAAVLSFFFPGVARDGHRHQLRAERGGGSVCTRSAIVGPSCGHGATARILVLVRSVAACTPSICARLSFIRLPTTRHKWRRKSATDRTGEDRRKCNYYI